MKTRDRKIPIVLALCLTVMAMVIPSIGLGVVDCSVPPMEQDPNYSVTAVRVAGPLDFADPMGPANDPNHTLWGSAPSTVVELGFKITADVNTQHMPGEIICTPGVMRVLNVQAMHDGINILFKVTFADPTKSDTIADVPLFHDSIAIGIPYPTTLYGGACTPGSLQPEMLHMGTPCDGSGGLPCCPMNLMFWRADKAEVENIVANSPGTTIETVETDMGLYNTYQNWNAGAWTLILGRVMINTNPAADNTFPGTNMVDLVPGQPRNIVFANWDGGIEERNGLKWIGIFGYLQIMP